MKEHAKKALKHDVSVAGKTIPTLLLVGLFLVGGGSAALLSTFGTVSGEADVDQAVELQSTSKLSFQGDQTAGETIIEKRTLESNANVATEVGFKTSCHNSSNADNPATRNAQDTDWNDIDWSTEGCTGIDTQYVEYFDSAGADFGSYSAPDSDSADVTVDTQSGLEEAVNNGVSQTVLVRTEDYDGFTVSDDDTVVAESRPDEGDTASVDGSTSSNGTAKGTGILVRGTGATVKGFEVTADTGSDNGETTDNGRGIDVQASDVSVESNYVHDVRTDDRPIGILVYGDAVTSGAMTGVVVENNLVENIDATKIEGDDKDESKARGIALEGGETYDEDKSSTAADGIEITGNTVRDVGGNGDAAMASGVRVYDGATNFKIKYNDISGIDHNEDTTSFGGTYRHPYAQGVYVSGVGTSPGSDNNVTRNNFELSADATIDAQFVKYGSETVYDKINADGNYWGTDGRQIIEESDVSDQFNWKLKTDTSIEAGTTDKFGVVNEFAINLVPDSYSLTTSITPAGAEETPS
jgi:hypothetical protein